MDQVEEEEGHDFCWDNLFPRERNSQEQSPSGEAVDPTASFPSPERKPSPLNLLTTFGFSFEHLEELSHYPHDQLTPENMTVLLQAIQKHKLAPKLPRLPLKSSEKETVSSADGCGPTVKKKVIDYGHKSKYGYNEGPMEMNASSIATDEGVEGCPTQQPESVPAVASSVISSPKNPTKELMRQAGSTPNLQASPLVAPAKKAPLAELQAPARVPAMMPPAVLPMPQPVIPPVILPVLMPVLSQRPPPFAPEFLSRHGSYEHTLVADSSSHPCRTVDIQESFWKEAEDPGTVKASWLPDFSQTDKEKEKKLPTAPQMCDYYAVTPRIFPHVCSLCNEDCIDKKDWIQHQNTLLHIVNCRWLLQQYPDWTPETLSSPRRNKDDRQEMQESRRRCASPSPKRSRRSSSGHARHRTRSQSRSSERHRTSRPRSRSPRCLPSPRHRSRSPRQSLHSSRQSQSSASKQRRAGSSAGLTAAPSVSQKVAAQADQAVSSSKEASRMQTSAGEAAVSSQPVSSKAETSGVGRPSPRPATPGPCKAKNRGVKQQLVLGNSPPRPGLADVSSHLVGSKAETSVVAHPWIQPGTPAPSKLKIRGLKQKLITGSVPPCPGEATVSIKAETSGLAHPSPQTATSGPCKAKIRGVKQKLVAGSVPPRPAALSSQPVRSKAEISGVARPQAATSGPSKARIRGVKQKQAVPGNVPPLPGKAVVSSKAESSGVEESQGVAQKVVLGGVPPCQKAAAVSSQPVRSKAETSGLAPPSPQTATSGPSKAKIQGVKQKVPGSVPPLPGKAAVCPQPVSSKAETFGVARPSPQTATSRLCKAKIRGVKQKLVDGSISSCSGEATVHSQTLRSKAEISGVACPSPHQGTSGPCKAKNQDVVPGSIPSGPDLFKPAAKPRVWVCGGSLVVSAQKWDLQKRQFGQLDWLQQNITLEWHGQEDLTWAQLVATVQKLAAQGQAPDVLILHLGEKDLLSTPWPALSQTIRREVGLLKEAFPKVRLMWSEMLPQNIRPAGMEACNVEELLREANLVVGGFISGLGGMVIKHGEIANCVFTLNLEGGGLSYIGLDLFLEDIRNAVRAHVLQSSGAAGGGLQGGRNASPFASLAASAGLGTMSQEAAIEGNQTVSSSKEASEILRKRKQRKRGCEHRGKCDEADRKVCCELPAGFLGQPQEKNAETHIWKVSFQFKHESDKQGRQESRHRSASPSPRRSRRSSSGHARHRTRSQSRSSERHRTSRPRSRSPRCLPSPRHRSRSPRQSLHSSRQSQSSASKQRRAGSSAGLTEGQHAKTTCSKIKHDERKQTYRSSDLMSMIQQVATQGEEETCVVVISNLPEAGLSLDEISNLIKPFGGLKDVLILSSHKKAYLEVNQKSADSLVKFYASIPVWVETRQLSISMAPEFKDLKDEEAIFISMIKDANPKANVEALHAQFVHLGNLPDGGYSELEILCIGLRFGRVDHYVVISNKRKAILLLDSAKSAASMCRFLKNSPYSLRQSELTFSRSPKIDPLPGEEETCVVVISDLPEAGLSLDEISNLIKPFGELKDVLILSSHQKAYLEVSQRSADSLVKFYACIPVWVKTRQLCIRMVPEFMDLKDEEAIFISMIKDANPKVNVEALHAQLVHLGNLPDSGYTKLEILCIGLRFGRVDHYVVISNKRKAILQLDSAESAASMCRFLKSSPYSLRESELTFSRSPKIDPLPVEVTRKEVKKQEPSNESPDLKKIPEGSGLVHTASVPSAKPAEAKEEPICKLKVATAEVKKEPSEKTECEALSKPSETATSEGKLAALTTEVGDLSSSELKSEKPVALASGLGEEEKVTDTALAEFLGNTSPVATGGKDEESAGPAAELSEGLKGTAGIGGTGAGPAKTEQGVEAAPAICETVSLGSTEAPVEELSGEDLQSNTRLVPPGPGHADAPRNLAEMSTGEVEGMVDKEPENPSSATEGSMEVEAETVVPEPTEPAKEKPELQSGKAEAASEKQPEVLASNDKPAQEEKLERKADDRSPEQGLPKSQPRKEMGQGQLEGSRKGDVLATVLAPSAEATSVSKTILKALMSVPNISKKRTVTRRKEEQKPAAKPGTRSSTVAEKKPVPKEASQQRPTISRSKLPDSKPKVKLSSLVVKVGNGKSSSQQDKDSQVEPKGSSKQTQEQEARSSTVKLDSNKEKVFPGRNSRSSHRCTNPNEEEELFPFNLDEFVTVDEVTDEVDSPSQPRRNPLRGKRKDAAREPSSKRRKAKTSDDHGAAGQELSFVTLDEIGEDEGGMGQAAEHLEGMPDPQALVTVDEVNDEEELISIVARDPQSLVTLDEISEQEDPAAHETMKETGGEPDLKAEPLVTVDEIGEVEELPLNELSHLKTETSNNRREEKQVLLVPGDLLSSQALEDPSTLFTVDEIHEDSENQPLVTLDEVTEEEDDFLEGEFNFVTVDEVGSKDEEEEKVTVIITNMNKLVATTVLEEDIPAAVAEPTEGFLLAVDQEETAILDAEDVPEENKVPGAPKEATEKESVVAEVCTLATSSEERGVAQVAECLEAMPNPQELVTTSEVHNHEDLISDVAQDSQISEQEDPSAPVKEADNKPDLKTEPLVTMDKIGELLLNQPSHFKTDAWNNRQEEKQVLLDPGDLLSSQVPEDPSALVTVDEIYEDSSDQPRVTLDEVTEEDNGFLEGELNFVIVDEVGSKDEEEEKVTVTGANMDQLVATRVPEKETAAAVPEPTESLPLTHKQEAAAILDEVSRGKKACPAAELPEESKAFEALIDIAEKENAAAEIDTQEMTFVEGGVARVPGHLEAMPDLQVLVTVDEVSNEEELTSEVARDPLSFVTLDEISEQEDPAAHETDSEPDLKAESLVVVDETGEVEELPLKQSSHFKTDTLNDKRKDKRVLEDLWGLLSSQGPEDPSTFVAVDEIQEDSSNRLLVMLGEVTEEDNEFLGKEFNFVTVDEVGSEDETEEKLTVTGTSMEELNVTTVPGKKTAVAESTESLPSVDEQEETAVLDEASQGEKASLVENVPEENKAPGPPMEAAEKESAAAEIFTQGTCSVGGGMAQVAERLEALLDHQQLVTVDEVYNEEELFSGAAWDPKSLVTLDEISEQEDPAAHETVKEADGEPDFKSETLVRMDEIREVEELPLNQPLHFKTRREEKQVLLDPGDLLFSQVPEDPSTLVTVDEIYEDSDDQPRVTLDEVTEEDVDFLEGELNFVTLDEVGNEDDEEEENVSVIKTSTDKIVLEKETAVHEPAEGSPSADKQRKTGRNSGEKVCSAEKVPEGNKASAETERVAAERETQEPTSVEAEKGEGGEGLEQTLADGTEQGEPPSADIDFLVPKAGFFCQICSCFSVDEPSMKSHCQSALHQQNKKKFMNKKAEEEEKKESDGDSAQESSR
ncbi:uncharacterized protein LOC143819562 isoform X2 [Paroedura picta]|uniref:uncharacterized protein LOC143819562 isoform X2 n=1 Tax=Paroedura picta TaxID=143630 RepID=UPI00405764DE